MTKASSADHQIQYVTNFEDLVSTPFQGAINAICWSRQLVGDFGEIVGQIELSENIVELHSDELLELKLSPQGQQAREILLQDMKRMEAHGASPTLNLIQSYERDDDYPFFPRDVYSFHIDRATVPSDTFLCTYYGSTSEIIPNVQAQQKVLIPEIRAELMKLHGGQEKDFEDFLMEEFFDLHYQVLPNAQPISLAMGHICRLAIDHPESSVLPCIHRAPMEAHGLTRLMMIC